MNGVIKGATLPLEAASVSIRKNKQTTDLAKGLRYFIGKATAQEFYAKRNSKGHSIMDNETFDTVTWEDLHDTLVLKPKMYQLWFGKQGSDHCGTGVMLQRWDKSANSRCSNCGKLNEDANHLNRCMNKGRQLMLLKCIHELKEWMIDNNIYPVLIKWIPQYLLKQGKKLHQPWHQVPQDAQSGRGAGPHRMETFHRRKDCHSSEEPPGSVATNGTNSHDH